MKHYHISSLSRRDRAAMERRRLNAGRLFKKGLSQVEVARRCKVSREAARQWHDIWKQQGKQGLKSRGKPGPKPKLNEIKKKKVEKVLLKGPLSYGYTTDIWTLDRIAKVIKQIAKVSYHPGRVWHILSDMNWSCQKPETRVKERDEKAIRHWQKVEWPRIQKRG